MVSMDFLKNIRMSEPIKESIALNTGYADAQRLVQYLKRVQDGISEQLRELLAYVKDDANKTKISGIKSENGNLIIPLDMLDKDLTAVKEFVRYYDALVRVEEANAALDRVEALMSYIENNAQIDGLDNLSKQIMSSEALLAASLGDVGRRRAEATE